MSRSHRSARFLPAVVLVTWGVLATAAALARPNAKSLAEHILQKTGVTGGFVVHLGCDDGELTVALRASDSYQVHGLDTDAAEVDAARRRIDAAGVYGPVSADRLRGSGLPYVDNLVNLLVVEERGEVSDEEILRVLVPEGVAYIRSDDSWKKVVKPRPGSIDDWTHFLHDATGNAVARDTIVGPPQHLQWLGSPRWSRHHDRMASMSALVSTEGRVFYILDEGSRVSIQLPPKWTLVARDAFNGTVLWKRSIPSWNSHLWPLKSGPTQLARRLVAVGDRVYVTRGLAAPLEVLDAATGETLHTHEDSKATEEVVVAGDRVFAVVNKGELQLASYRPRHNVGDQQRVANEFTWDEKPREIHAYAVDSGDLLWTVKSTVAPITLTVADEAVLFHDGKRVRCLDAASGEPHWSSEPGPRRDRVTMNFAPRLVVVDDVVLFAGGDRTMHALELASGEEMWSASHARSGYQSPEDLLVVQGLVWSAPTTSSRDSGVFTGRDLRTGEVKVEFPPDVDTYWFHHRCHLAKATERFILPSRTGIEFVDTKKKSWKIHHWVRGGCLYGVMPCNGLVYAPPHNCACYPEAKLFGFNALAPASATRRTDADAPPGERLEKGPAFGSPLVDSSAGADWPTYRGDNARSGATTVAVEGELAPAWKRELGGRLSSVTVADGRLHVAQVDAHTVHALGAASGDILWSFKAGGRVDSPPTFWKGRLYFGSADGHVYCLRASDGELVWRFRAAPRDLRLMALEQLESVWPVHGSILVEDGSACFVAGRSNFLDGGIHFYRLDATTGKLEAHANIDEKDPVTGENVQERLQVLNMTVGLPDILSSDGEALYMRSQRLDRDGKRLELGPHSGVPAEQGAAQHGEGAHLFAPMGFTDATWFHRAYWVFGKSFAGGHAGYYQAGKYAPSGRLLVFDDESVYGFGRRPEYYRWTTTLEHHLFKAPKEPPEVAKSGQPKMSIARFEKTASINPAGKAVTVEAWVKAEKPGGVIVARGGPAHGYALYLERGRPRFAVRIDSKLAAIGATRRVVGDWTHLVGLLDADGGLRLYIDGELAASGKAPGLITADPAQSLEIAGDEGGAVGDYRSPFLFTGSIDEVRVYHGTLGEEEIRERSSNLGRAPAENATLALSCSFDDGDARDGSGNDNHGKTSDTEVVKGKLGNALRFTGRGPRSAGSFVQHAWVSPLPLYVSAMALAGDTLFVVGPPDLIDEEETFQKLVAGDDSVAPELREQQAALDGARGSYLLGVARNEGRKVSQLRLDELPVWDGLAAAGGKLYLATEKGNVVCLAPR